MLHCKSETNASESRLKSEVNSENELPTKVSFMYVKKEALSYASETEEDPLCLRNEDMYINVKVEDDALSSDSHRHRALDKAYRWQSSSNIRCSRQ